MAPSANCLLHEGCPYTSSARGMEQRRYQALFPAGEDDTASGLGFKQSSLRHVARALQGHDLQRFHSYPASRTCYGPLHLSAPVSATVQEQIPSSSSFLRKGYDIA